MTSAISLKGVTRAFDSRDGDRIVALQDVSLDIAANQFITLVGPSGCGKSTLLRIVAGLILLTWARTVAFPRPLLAAATALGGASMWILISHFQVWPELAARLPIGVAYPATILVGIAIWRFVEAVPRLVRQRPPLVVTYRPTFGQ